MDGERLAVVEDRRQKPRSKLGTDGGEKPAQAADRRRKPRSKLEMDGDRLTETWDERQIPPPTEAGGGRREACRGRRWTARARSKPAADYNTPGLLPERTASGEKWAGDGRTALTLGSSRPMGLLFSRKTGQKTHFVI